MRDLLAGPSGERALNALVNLQLAIDDSQEQIQRHYAAHAWLVTCGSCVDVERRMEALARRAWYEAVRAASG